MQAVRAVVANADPLARNLLRAACRAGAVRVVGEATTTTEAVALCRSERPDVAVVATPLAGPGGTASPAGGGSDDGALGLEACVEQILAVPAQVVVLSDDLSPERLMAVLLQGASGYLLLDTPPDQVVEAIVAVAAGRAVLSPPATRVVLDQWRQLRHRDLVAATASGTALTSREREVLAAMAEGLAAKAIARRLGIAVKTVENHKIRIFDKLGVRSQANAVSVAIGWGLLAEPVPSENGQS